jgi:CheY-like chemotaxis protein
VAIISIFSGAYCLADQVADGVSKQLEYPFIDEQVIDEAARRFEIPRDKLEKTLSGAESMFNRFTHEREKNLAFLRLALAELIQSDNVIIRGCLGHLLPRTISHVLRLCLIANHDFRVARAVRESGEPEKDASRLVHEDDKKNFACTENLCGKSAYDEGLYDMVLPMHDRSVEEAVKVVRDTARSEPVATTARSQQAARDFILSARVALALAREGLSADVYAESGHVIMSINETVVRLEKHRERLIEVARRVDGVAEASARLGPGYKAASVNPWSNIEGPPKIMLVDDEKEFVHTLSERLRTRQLESSIAYDGEQALELLEEDVPDVMVLDLMMPGIDGIETLRRIKKDHPEVEVIILTGHGSDREKRMAEELGAFAYLSKPVDIDLLARVMREAYGRSQPGASSRPEPPRTDDTGTKE